MTHKIMVPATSGRIGRALHKATARGIERFAATLIIAKRHVATAIDRQLEHMHTRKYLRAADGTVFCLYYADAWCYDIFGVDHVQRGFPASCILGTIETYDEALAAMQSHVDQYADARKGGEG